MGARYHLRTPRYPHAIVCPTVTCVYKKFEIVHVMKTLLPRKNTRGSYCQDQEISSSQRLCYHIQELPLEVLPRLQQALRLKLHVLPRNHRPLQATPTPDVVLGRAPHDMRLLQPDLSQLLAIPIPCFNERDGVWHGPRCLAYKCFRTWGGRGEEVPLVPLVSSGIGEVSRAETTYLHS
jgi:hypothetical protein